MSDVVNEILTDKEKEVFAVLKRKKKVSLDELVSTFGEPNDIKSRHGMNVRIKSLGYKLSEHGWIVRRITGIGRGAKAIFTMEKKF